MPWKKIALIALLCAVGLGLVSWASTHSSSYEVCKEERHSSGDKAPQFGKQFAYFVVCEGVTIDSNGDLLVALGTIAIAAFTLTLWLTSRDQARLIGEQIRLAREEYISTHRPKIIIHSVEFLTVNSPISQTVGADIAIFNVGDTVAKNLVVSGNIFEHPNTPPPGLFFKEVDKRAAVKAGTGDRIEVSIGSQTPLAAHRLSAQLSADGGDKEYVSNLRCIGTVSYDDENGVRRVTGFCWRLQGERWVRQTKSAYEYSY